MISILLAIFGTIVLGGGIYFLVTCIKSEFPLFKTMVGRAGRIVCGVVAAGLVAGSISMWALAYNVRPSDGEEADQQASSAIGGLAPTMADTASDEASDTEESESDPIDWDSMAADFLYNGPVIDDGALRALKMTERDYHEFELEYDRTFSRSSQNEMGIYRISHMKRLNAFSLSLIADQGYFDANEKTLEYFYDPGNLSAIDLDGKLVAKARQEMADLYKIWEEEAKDLDPEDRGGYFRQHIEQEIISNPSATLAWLKYLSQHVVFTKNNSWIKEDLKAMEAAYKLNPETDEVVGTATFLEFGNGHKDGEKECSYEHVIVNDEQFERACRVARLFELMTYEGIQAKTSVKNWALEVNDDVSDLTTVKVFDKSEDQLSSKAVCFAVYDENGKTKLADCGVNCYDSRLEEFAITVPKTPSNPSKPNKPDPPQNTDPELYPLTLYYRFKGEPDVDLLAPFFLGNYPEKAAYGPFEMPQEIVKDGRKFKLVTTPQETIGTMPKGRVDFIAWYDEVKPTPSSDPTPTQNSNPTPSDPTPENPQSTPEDPGTKPEDPGSNPTPETSKKDDSQSSDQDNRNDQGAGTPVNENKSQPVQPAEPNNKTENQNEQQEQQKQEEQLKEEVKDQNNGQTQSRQEEANKDHTGDYSTGTETKSDGDTVTFNPAEETNSTDDDFWGF